MCLERPSEKKVAEKNIICWKRLSLGGKSIIQEYQYRAGKVQPQVDIKVYRSIVEAGYHSWVDQQRIDSWGQSHGEKAKHLFVIPKGTVYYEGLENGGPLGYTSETIVYLGHVNNPLTWLRKLKYENK